MSDDDRLEEAFRASLRERAGDVTADGDIAQVARAGARRRQRIKVGVAGVAAAAVIAPVGVLAALQGDDGRTPTAAGPGTAATPGGATAPSIVEPGTTDPTGSSGGVPDNWRVESYDGVQLRVPPDWGWGSVPRDGGWHGRLIMCGNGAFAYPGPNGETRFKESVDMPYVGRPYLMTDDCTELVPPTQPYVWFASPLQIGTVQLERGFTQETAEVAGMRVTVADDDADELATILGTLEAVDVDANGCEVVSRLTESGDPVADLDKVDSVSVCAYRYTDGDGVFLNYSTFLEGAPAQQLLELIKAESPGDLDCDPAPRLNDVVLRFHGPQETDADVLVRLDGCSGYYTGEGVRLLTRANVEPWVVDGVGLYVSGHMFVGTP